MEYSEPSTYGIYAVRAEPHNRHVRIHSRIKVRYPAGDPTKCASTS
ncbi:hypothetical protein RHCRD62_30364 [Rhodococcus sp. RD6.2]|nr:hypothetical protein RHCRD62_30364 [Rhodococcus sp. RD6.2]